jgi:ubiquinone/menaquinone biosynthesis C-methylase UbiE
MVESLLHWEARADDFDLERTALGYRIRHVIITNLLSAVFQSDNVALDLGCGTGEYTILMQTMGFGVVATDFSKAMLSTAQSKIKKLRAPERVQLVNSECSKLPFENDVFDLIVCIAVLDSVPSYNQVLNEAYRVVKNEGKFIVCVDSVWAPSFLCTKTLKLIRKRRERNLGGSLNYKNLADSMKGQGFIIEKLYGDIFLGQAITSLLFDPRKNYLTKKIMKVLRPVDFYLTRLVFIKSLSAHYILEARKERKT